jgi:hypothetical protein
MPTTSTSAAGIPGRGSWSRTLGLIAGMVLSGTAIAVEEPGPAEPAGVEPAVIEAGSGPRIDGQTPQARMAALRQYCATVDIPAKVDARGVMMYIAARLIAGRDVPAMLAKWEQVAVAVDTSAHERLAKEPKDNNARNPFEKHALIHAYMLTKDQVPVPPSLVAVMKRYVAVYKHRAWFGYGALNYRLMNDGAGFIAAEQWPDLVDADGLDAAGIQAATRARLFGYFAEIVRHNTDEYGAPTYLGIDLSALKLLAGHARDPEMRQRATLTLDAMLLQVACAWNNSSYVTSASRAKYFSSSMSGPDALDTTGAIAWLLWGGWRPVDPGHMNPAGCYWFAAGDAYAPPALFSGIATDRTQSFTHRASAQARIRLTIRHEPTYALASEWTDLTGPTEPHCKESRRTMLKWRSPSPDSTFIPMQENPRRPYRLQEGIANAFGYGENPFTQVLQDDRTLIGISAVPASFPYWRNYAPFTKRGAIVARREEAGWVFCHGGSMLFAFRYLTPATWGKSRDKEQVDVLTTEARTTGWILETSPLAAFAGGDAHAELDRFAQAIQAHVQVDAVGLTQAVPRFAVTALSGHRLDLVFRPFGIPYSDQQRIDGQPIPYATFPLLGNPWMQQPLGADRVVVTREGHALTYDFAAWTRTAAVAP